MFWPVRPHPQGLVVLWTTEDIAHPVWSSCKISLLYIMPCGHRSTLGSRKIWGHWWPFTLCFGGMFDHEICFFPELNLVALGEKQSPKIWEYCSAPWTGGVVGAVETTSLPPPEGLPCQFWQFYDKWSGHRQGSPKKLGSLKPCPLE